ncbi:YidC/Oxa1 family membrane protein insertase [Clostridium cavendishii DSM 21758]|uniref:YidC/Oxa1 family membrane protein insertase n=1 Tax=Clostridium cavendishii DSM 21758 TaxID=1121302 RepID=A0A1M6TL85_9CLOT|nr:membrane protein insertase YidC [Clostridium cavendishii]SHK57680.1 YidC/Oxa1 family membrane protein insertase [Clostridium cavendishii DSM 21758]
MNVEFLKVPMAKFFELLHNFVVNNLGVTDVGLGYVLSIFLLTLMVRLVLLPLNVKQLKSQAKMNEIQPEVKKLQNKYKSDPQKANMEVMKLYKDNKVNPMSGCLPLFIQMPILIALYWVFIGVNGLDGASFLWIADLGAKRSGIVLPLLSAATTYLSSWLMTSNTPKQEGGMNMGSMNIGMAIMMGFMAINFKPALVLYWIMGNIIQIAQTYVLVVRPAKKKAAIQS